MTSLVVLDYDTVSGVDKFGNVFVLRLPPDTNDDIDNPTGSRMLWDQGLLNGAPTKVETLAHYYLGEAPTAAVLCSLVPGGRPTVLVSTIMGGIYSFTPLTSKEDIDFFQHLEMFMRQERINLCQRDHLSYRSYFQPVKKTFDGDLCELFASLSYKKQMEMAEDVDRSPTEILKKLEDARNSLL